MYYSLISSMSKFNYIVIDTDAQAFITAASITNNTQKSAIDNLVISLKSYGIWSKMKALYPMVGGTASSHKFNLKDPRDLDVAFRLQFNGGWTHSSNGIQGNGTNGIVNTYLIPNSILQLNSTHLSVYCRTNNSSAEMCDIGSIGTNNNWTVIEIYQNLFYNLINQNTSTSNSLMFNSLGMFIGSRTSFNILKSYKNNNLLQTFTNSSNQKSDISLTIAGFNRPTNPQFYSNRNYAFASIGDGLTDTEASNFYTAVQAYQTSLSRQV